jgi:uncharacterized membrane protein YqjE
VPEPRFESPGAGESGAGGFAGALGLLAAAWKYFQARLELAGLESREAAAIYLKSAVILAGGLVVVVFGYFFFCLGAVFAIASALGGGVAWIWVTFAAALLHFAVAIALLWKVKRLVSQPVFSTTMDEFRRDQSWLNATIAKNN